MPPFEIESVSWPQPVEVTGTTWISSPAWNAPYMPGLPLWSSRIIDGKCFWTIDWRDYFRSGVKRWNPLEGGELRGFQVVFTLRIRRSGTLQFYDDDGCIIRRNGEIVHEDRSAHTLMRHEIPVKKGDKLRIAQWQYGWEWMWCARILGELAVEDCFRAWLPAVEESLRARSGPPLKMYTNLQSPLRTIAAIYSMIVNGYCPNNIFLYGEEQWSQQNRVLVSRLLPCARVVPEFEVFDAIRHYGGYQLAALARKHWFVRKALIALAVPPMDSCLMDDDVLILDRVHDALDAFSTHDLVYAPDQDLGDGYLQIWSHAFPNNGTLRTRRFNAGLYWIRNTLGPHGVTRAALVCNASRVPCFLWEQGLIAMAYKDRSSFELSNRRYLFPLFDGLPGGVLGYDYGCNPCGFTAIHYGGLAEKPSDAIITEFVTDVLQRQCNKTSSDSVDHENIQHPTAFVEGAL